MSRLTDRLERDLREVAAGAQPSPSAWESIVARLDDDAEPAVALSLAPVSTLPRRPVWLVLAAAALVVIIGSVAVLSMPGDDRSGFAAELTTTFVSPRNGYSIHHPDGASVTPAVQLWEFGEKPDDGFDVIATGSQSVFKGTSIELENLAACVGADNELTPCGSSDARIDNHLSNALPGWCGVHRDQQAEITIDGQPGRVAACPNRIEATVVFGGRLYVFTLTRDGSDARAVFDAFVATIDLTPDTAVRYPAMTTTFVSPTYGYSFKFHDRGGLAPATELWDPANQPLAPRNLDKRVDGVETGLGAYFEAASTPIPDGVPIDEWVDEHVTPRAAGGCDVPRREQAEITIDGQPGRVARCDHDEATVVAGGRLYLFTGPNDDRRWFEAWITTIDLTPETAVVR